MNWPNQVARQSRILSLFPSILNVSWREDRELPVSCECERALRFRLVPSPRWQAGSRSWLDPPCSARLRQCCSLCSYSERVLSSDRSAVPDFVLCHLCHFSSDFSPCRPCLPYLRFSCWNYYASVRPSKFRRCGEIWFIRSPLCCALLLVFLPEVVRIRFQSEYLPLNSFILKWYYYFRQLLTQPSPLS